MNKNTITRIIVGLVILTMIFCLPWWVGAIAALIAGIFFHMYYELLFFGVVLDALVTTPATGIFGFHYVFSVAALILFLVIVQVRKKLRFNTYVS